MPRRVAARHRVALGVGVAVECRGVGRVAQQRVAAAERAHGGVVPAGAQVLEPSLGRGLLGVVAVVGPLEPIAVAGQRLRGQLLLAPRGVGEAGGHGAALAQHGADAAQPVLQVGVGDREALAAAGGRQARQAVHVGEPAGRGRLAPHRLGHVVEHRGVHVLHQLPALLHVGAVGGHGAPPQTEDAERRRLLPGRLGARERAWPWDFKVRGRPRSRRRAALGPALLVGAGLEAGVGLVGVVGGGSSPYLRAHALMGANMSSSKRAPAAGAERPARASA